MDPGLPLTGPGRGWSYAARMAEELDEATLAFAHRMFELARSGETEALVEQLDAGLPVNLTNDKGDTLLTLAAYYERLDTVRALVDRGADTARVNDRGQTALAAAAFRRSLPIVGLLLDASADPLLGGPSAIEVAQFFDHPDVVAVLMGQRRAGSADD